MKHSPFLVPIVFAAVLASVQPTTCFAQEEQSTGPRKVATRIVPLYPQMARSMNLSGGVKLEVLVEPNGSVKAVQVKGGNPLLVQSAQAAVRGWKWEKGEHETTEEVEFHFSP